MKKSKRDLRMIIVSILIIGINTVSLSKYDYVANGNAQAQIAKAIFIVEKDETIKKQIDQNSFPLEYNFTINNYEGDKINEVNLEYNIEIETNEPNFPVSYVLLDRKSVV